MNGETLKLDDMWTQQLYIKCKIEFYIRKNKNKWFTTQIAISLEKPIIRKIIYQFYVVQMW